MLKPRAANAPRCCSPCVLSAVFASMIFSHCGFAQEGLSDEDIASLYDDESVSIATGSSTPLFLAPAVASVVTREDIARSGAVTLDDVLEKVPGVHVAASSNRLNSVYSIRGLHTAQNPQVLLLVDGYPVQDAFTSGRPVTFRLSVNQIERVEIVRGPGSAVYGADAFAGVINVITHASDAQNSSDAGVRLGSFDSREAWAVYRGDHLHVGVEYSVSDGDDSRVVDKDLQTGLDAVFDTNASVAPGPLQTQFEVFTTNVVWQQEAFKLQFWSWQQNDAGLGPGGAALDDEGYVDVGHQRLSGIYHWSLSPTLQLDLQGVIRHQKEEDYALLLPPGSRVLIDDNGNVAAGLVPGARLVDFPGGMIGAPGGEEWVYQLETVFGYSAIERHNLRLAAGYRLSEMSAFEEKNYGPGVLDAGQTVAPPLVDVTDTPYLFTQDKDKDIYSRYLSFQDIWKFANDWDLTVGFRYDDYSDFGDTINPRLALVWAMQYNLSAKLLYGRAFRAPSYSERYAINNPVLTGNPKLDSETIDTMELAFDYRPVNDVTTKLNLFYYETRDLIDLVPVGINSVAANAGTQTGIGGEFEFDWRPAVDWRFYGSFAYQKSKKRIEFEGQSLSNDVVPDAPARQIDFGIQKKFNDNYYLTLSMERIGGRHRPGGYQVDALPDYSNVNLGFLARNVIEQVDVSVLVKNALDKKQYVSISNSELLNPEGGYLLPERSASVSTTLRF